MHSYFILSSKFRKNSQYTEEAMMGNIPRDMRYMYKPAKGLRMGSDYPEKLVFDIQKDDFDGNELPPIPIRKLNDVIDNTFGYLMVSSKVKAIFEKYVTTEIEFLPFLIRNSDQKILPDEYYIANLIGSKDVVDIEKTEPKPKYGFYPHSIQRLYIIPDKLTAEDNLFRISSMTKTIMVRDDLRKVLENENITGIHFKEMGEPVNLML